MPVGTTLSQTRSTPRPATLGRESCLLIETGNDKCVGWNLRMTPSRSFSRSSSDVIRRTPPFSNEIFFPQEIPRKRKMRTVRFCHVF